MPIASFQGDAGVCMIVTVHKAPVGVGGSCFVPLSDIMMLAPSGRQPPRLSWDVMNRNQAVSATCCSLNEQMVITGLMVVQH